MKPEGQIVSELSRAAHEGRLVSCKVPGDSDLIIAFERHILEEALASWRAYDGPSKRAYAFRSVNREISRAVKHITRGKTTKKVMDALHADVALWLAHELLFNGGERHLIELPKETFKKAMN